MLTTILDNHTISPKFNHGLVRNFSSLQLYFSKKKSRLTQLC